MDHLEFAALESASDDADVVWLAWCACVETLLGGSLDGTGIEEEPDFNGYSLDEAFEYFEDGGSPEGYYALISARPGFNVRPRIGGAV